MREKGRERDNDSLYSILFYYLFIFLMYKINILNDFNFLKYSQRIKKNINVLLEISSFNKIHDIMHEYLLKYRIYQFNHFIS